MTHLPNLELLEYKIRQNLINHSGFMDKFNKKKQENQYVRCDLVFTMFIQLWSSTCTGFDICEDGSPAWGGASMTEEYTVIAHERTTDTYIVCFGERPCYIVEDTNEAFFEDMKNCNMASLSNAKNRY